jgi:hypothetical protein
MPSTAQTADSPEAMEEKNEEAVQAGPRNDPAKMPAQHLDENEGEADLEFRRMALTL